MLPENPAATAEGDFRRTPLAHLLVYMADRRLSGVLVLQEPQGTEHAVLFEWGSPVRVAPGDGYALFGEMLVEAGIVAPDIVENALATKGLLGDVLILTGHAEADELENVASEQLLRRMVRLFALPADTSYRYFEKVSALHPTAPGGRVDLLRLLFEGLRAHPRAGLSLSKLLEALGDTPLRLHPDALLDRFGFGETEQHVIDAIAERQPALVDLLAEDGASADVVRCVVYTLLITRQLDLGQRTLPLGHDEPHPAVTLGRVALASALHRDGAAAPDPAGDGERAAVMPRTLRRRRDGHDPQPNVPSLDSDSEDEPVSDVIEICPPPGAKDGRAKACVPAEASFDDVEFQTGEHLIGSPAAAAAAGATLPPLASGVRTRAGSGPMKRLTPEQLASTDELADLRKRDAYGGSRGS